MSLDCQKCGACCASPVGNLACGVTAEDRRRLGWLFARRHCEPPPPDTPGIVAILARRWRGYATGPLAGKRLRQCIALEGDVRQHVRCRVYERRPAACRNMEPGDSGCMAAREKVGA